MEKRTLTWEEYEKLQAAKDLMCYHCRLNLCRSGCTAKKVLEEALQCIVDKQVVHVMIGTNRKVLEEMQAGIFNDTVWASDNLETVAHYYEGCVVGFDVQLLRDRNAPYSSIPVGDSGYGWGRCVVNYPEGAVWYSFSREYLKENILSVREEFPDLSAFQDDDE